MEIKAILFDLDGVICSTDEYHYKAWKSLADDLGIYFDKEINLRLRGVSRMDSLEIILEKSSRQYTKEEKEEFASIKNNRYVKLLDGLGNSDILPGINEFLEECKRNNIKTALASASKNAPYIIKKLNLEKDFDYLADATKIVRSKPYPDIFIEAARGLGIDRKYCIGIEDAISGIRSIHAAGMKAVGIGDRKILNEADLIFKTTSDLNFKEIETYFKKEK